MDYEGLKLLKIRTSFILHIEHVLFRPIKSIFCLKFEFLQHYFLWPLVLIDRLPLHRLFIIDYIRPVPLPIRLQIIVSRIAYFELFIQRFLYWWCRTVQGLLLGMNDGLVFLVRTVDRAKLKDNTVQAVFLGRRLVILWACHRYLALSHLICLGIVPMLPIIK